jgi:hypothetical protein
LALGLLDRGMMGASTEAQLKTQKFINAQLLAPVRPRVKSVPNPKLPDGYFVEWQIEPVIEEVESHAEEAPERQERKAVRSP